MSTTGAYSRNFRTGGSKGTLHEVIHKSLNSARGSAYKCEPGTIVWNENYALAAALSDYYETNQRYANQADPERISVFLSRYMDIYGLVRFSNETDNARRARLALHLSLFTKPPTSQNVTDYLTAIVGEDVFGAILTTDSSLNESTLPGGVTIPGGVTLASGDWKSPINSITITLNQPSTVSNGDFYARYNTVTDRMDMYLPAYVKFEIGRILHDPTLAYSSDTGRTNLTNSNNANVKGFYLDDDYSLDNELFDE